MPLTDVTVSGEVSGILEMLSNQRIILELLVGESSEGDARWGGLLWVFGEV